MRTNVTSADIARILGVSRARVAQLRKSGELPEPTNTSGRPSWTPDALAEWLASKGRRLDSREASWLLPGPDLPMPLSPVNSTLYGHAHSERMSVRRYESPYTPTTWNHVGYETRKYLWLCVPYFTDGVPQFSALEELCSLINDDLDAGVLRKPTSDTLLGTAIVSVASNNDSSGVYAADVYADGTRVWTVAGRHDAADLTRALGHHIPLWPAVAATPAYVDSWDPRSGPLPVTVAPGLASQYRFSRLCLTLAESHPDMADRLVTASRFVFDLPVQQAADDYDDALALWKVFMDVVPAVTLPCEPDDVDVDVDALAEAAQWLTTRPDIPAWASQMAYLHLPVPTRSLAVPADALPEEVTDWLTHLTWSPTTPQIGQAQAATNALDHCTQVSLATCPSTSLWWATGLDPLDGTSYVSVPCATSAVGTTADQVPATPTQLRWIPSHAGDALVLIALNADATFSAWEESDQDPSATGVGRRAHKLVSPRGGEPHASGCRRLSQVVSAGVATGHFDAPVEQVRALLEAQTDGGDDGR